MVYRNPKQTSSRKIDNQKTILQTSHNVVHKVLTVISFFVASTVKTRYPVDCIEKYSHVGIIFQQAIEIID